MVKEVLRDGRISGFPHAMVQERLGWSPDGREAAATPSQRSSVDESIATRQTTEPLIALNAIK
jgi:hypothetical protein